MGKKAQKRRGNSETRAPEAASAPTSIPVGKGMPVWAVPAATIIFAGVAWLVFDSATAAGSIALLGILASIILFASRLQNEIPPADRNRAASIDFGRKN